MNPRNAEIQAKISHFEAIKGTPEFLAERAAADADFLARMRVVNSEIARTAGCSGEEWRANAIIQSEPTIRAEYEARLRANGEVFHDDF